MAQRRNPRSMRNLLSTILFVAATALFAAVLFMYVQDRRENDNPPPPPSIPGQAQLKNVYDILVAQDLEVEYGRQGARIDNISSAGQQLIVEEVPLYVFLFESPAERERETARLNQDDVELLDSFGQPLPQSVQHTFHASNVFGVLDGGDDDLANEIDQALQQLP
jgi:hypothetical protein